MKNNWITRLLILVLSTLIIINIYVTLRSQGILEIRVNKSLLAMDGAIRGIKQPKDGKDGRDGRDGRDGYTPVKGVDYFDGKDSVSTHTTETIIKEVPVNGRDGIDGKDGYTPVKGIDYFDGLTPIIRCNESKDRWERQYAGIPGWSAILNEHNQPVKCKIPSNN